jgi:hypothetical protein
MSCLETFATLRILSPTLVPAQIGAALGIEPTRVAARDPSSRYRPRREHHFWAWSSEGQVDSLDGLVHVRAVLDLLQGREQALAELRRAGCELDVSCYWVSSGQGGPALDLDAMTRLAGLGLEIWWDVYFGDAREDEAARPAAGAGTPG